ncbi:MAG: succinylglutamate desuccinylase, partial [Ideonella sp.]
GILIFLAELGSELRAGTALAELIDPLSGAVTTLACPVDGVFFARESRRFVAAGSRIAKVAGEAAVRRGKLLSA